MELCRYQQLTSSQQQQSSPWIKACGGGVGISCHPGRPVGFRFIPGDHHLIYYLEQKFKNPNARFPLIHEIDLYNDHNCHPERLLASYGTEGIVYVLSPRYRRYGNGTEDRVRRETEDGTWKNSTKEKPIKRQGIEIGRTSNLVFHPNPDHKATNWNMKEYWIPKYHKPKGKTINEPMDEFVMYMIYSTKHPQKQGKSSGSKKRVQMPSAEELPAKKLDQKRGGRGIPKVEVVSNDNFHHPLQHAMPWVGNGPAHNNNTPLSQHAMPRAGNGSAHSSHTQLSHSHPLQHAMPQVGNGQAHYSHNQLSHDRDMVVNTSTEEYDDDQCSRDCDLIMSSDYYSDCHFQAAGWSSTSNTVRMQMYPVKPPACTFSLGPFVNSESTQSFYHGSANDNNGLQGGSGGSGGGSGTFGSSSGLLPFPEELLESSYGPPPFPDKLFTDYDLNTSRGFGGLEPSYGLITDYDLNTSSVIQMYADIASVPGHAPSKQAYQDLPPY